nr:hypothetical protein [Chitinispirillaceae bacterium]
ARLAERLPYLLDTTKTDWLKKVLAERPDFDPAMLAKVLASTVSHAYDIDTHHDTFSALFQEKGLSPEQVKEILRHAARLVAATAATGELPKGVMSSNTFMYFLNRECKLSLRYHTPFSLLIASILRIETSDSTFEIPATDQHPRLILKVVSTLKQKLREIDMIGVSSTAAESIIFAILPMTEETKTYGLAERLRHEFAALTLETNGRMAHLNLALSISGFDAAAMDGRTVFLKAAMAHHRAAEKILLAGIPQ